jgi:hypothetical protein
MNELIKKNNVGHNEQIKIFSDMLVQFSTWLQEGVVEEIEGDYRVIGPIKPWSPTKASNYSKGTYDTNGWYDWKNDNGQTLDDVYRKQQ